MKRNKFYYDFINIIKKIKFTFSQLYEFSFGNNHDVIIQPKNNNFVNSINYNLVKITNDDDWGWFIFID